MKLRNGFVSNSSSASFVVQARADLLDILGKKSKKTNRKIPNTPPFILTKKQRDALTEIGFVPFGCYNAVEIYMLAKMFGWSMKELCRYRDTYNKDYKERMKEIIPDLFSKDYKHTPEQWCFVIIINEMNVVDELVEHKIPFLMHNSEDETWIYDGKSDYITIIQNPGLCYYPHKPNFDQIKNSIVSGVMRQMYVNDDVRLQQTHEVESDED